MRVGINFLTDCLGGRPVGEGDSGRERSPGGGSGSDRRLKVLGAELSRNGERRFTRLVQCTRGTALLVLLCPSSL